MMRWLQILLLLIGLVFSLHSYAGLTDFFSGSDSNNAPLNADERMTQLENQMNNLQQLGLPTQIEQLQEKVAQLQGRLDEAEHELKQLESQQRDIYTDLDKRLTALSGNSSQTAETTISTPDMATSNQETQLYTSAFNLIRVKKYDEAIVAFQKYLKQYPSGQYGANAHYWLGQLYVLTNHSDKAATEFQIVAKEYSTSSKAPDAMLNLGSINYDHSKLSEAKNWWQKVIHQYADSQAAKVAAARLQQINDAGTK